MNENFATKSDIKELDIKLDSVESSMREVEYRLTIKLGTMSALAIGVTATLVKLISPGH